MVLRRGIQCDLLLGDTRRISVVSALLVLLILVRENGVRASIHEYKNEAFIPQYNSFFFHGGSKGLYASKVLEPSKNTAADDNNKPLNGKSFIRVMIHRRTLSRLCRMCWLCTPR